MLEQAYTLYVLYNVLKLSLKHSFRYGRGTRYITIESLHSNSHYHTNYYNYYLIYQDIQYSQCLVSLQFIIKIKSFASIICNVVLFLYLLSLIMNFRLIYVYIYYKVPIFLRKLKIH